MYGLKFWTAGLRRSAMNPATIAIATMTWTTKKPKFFHCELMKNEAGVRLAKRHDVLSLRALKEKGASPESLRLNWK